MDAVQALERLAVSRRGSSDLLCDSLVLQRVVVDDRHRHFVGRSQRSVDEILEPTRRFELGALGLGPGAWGTDYTVQGQVAVSTHHRGLTCGLGRLSGSPKYCVSEGHPEVS